MKPYDLHEHRHRYACWCAARAVQRGWSGVTTSLVGEAVAASGVASTLAASPKRWPTTADVYDRAHATWCDQAREFLEDQGTRDVSWGRVAKVMAIYVKTMVVIGGYDDHAMAIVAHPPVDRLLLQALARDESSPRDQRALWRRTKWTQLDQEGYDEIIDSLRVACAGEPFWCLEAYWGGT